MYSSKMHVRVRSLFSSADACARETVGIIKSSRFFLFFSLAVIRRSVYVVSRDRRVVSSPVPDWHNALSRRWSVTLIFISYARVTFIYECERKTELHYLHRCRGRDHRNMCLSLIEYNSFDGNVIVCEEDKKKVLPEVPRVMKCDLSS